MNKQIRAWVDLNLDGAFEDRGRRRLTGPIWGRSAGTQLYPAGLVAGRGRGLWLVRPCARARVRGGVCGWGAGAPCDLCLLFGGPAPPQLQPSEERDYLFSSPTRLTDLIQRYLEDLPEVQRSHTSLLQGCGSERNRPFYQQGFGLETAPRSSRGSPNRILGAETQ